MKSEIVVLQEFQEWVKKTSDEVIDNAEDTEYKHGVVNAYVHVFGELERKINQLKSYQLKSN